MLPPPSGPAASLGLLAAWTWLSLVFNLRYPATDHAGWVWLPSLDVTVVLALQALGARHGRRLPMSAMVAIAVVASVVRIFRVADGVTRRYFNRPLELATDLPLAPELGRLLGSTVTRPALIGGAMLALLALATVGVSVVWALRGAERCLRSGVARGLLAGVVGLTLVNSLLLRSDQAGARAGAFGASLAPVAAHQVVSWLDLDRRRSAALAEVRAMDRRLRGAPHALDRLHGANVLLFLVESYGETVVERPGHARVIGPVYERVAAVLRGAGFDFASGLLVSPTTAGRSWLAQETLATGVAVADHVTDVEVQRERPMTMARLFREAGYRTILAQPGSTHRALGRWSYDFDRVYSAWDFDYRGPAFGWAPMPDQLVVDVLQRRELAHAGRGLLVEYALVSSHAPWSRVPPIVSDWDAIGDGRGFDALPAGSFPIGWTNLAEASEAYLFAIAYDLDVLADYARRYVAGDALVIVIGDHQPAAEVTGFSSSRAVPVHVISRNRSFVDPFRARGFSTGMWPAVRSAPAGLETFLPDLLADFSSAP